MSRATVILNGPTERRKAASWAMSAPAGTSVTFREQKRSTDQNSKMWALLTEVAQQRTWHGVKLSPDDWKIIFMAALNQEMRIVPNLNGNGFVNLGRSSSDLSRDEMGQLLELITAWGVQNGVTFNDSQSEAA